MSSLLNCDRVQYLIEASKEETKPLAHLYFCIYCLALKSADILQLEVSDCTTNSPTKYSYLFFIYIVTLI